jgi:hypothetical protein
MRKLFYNRRKIFLKLTNEHLCTNIRLTITLILYISTNLRFFMKIEFSRFYSPKSRFSRFEIFGDVFLRTVIFRLFFSVNLFRDFFFRSYYTIPPKFIFLRERSLQPCMFDLGRIVYYLDKYTSFFTRKIYFNLSVGW